MRLLYTLTIFLFLGCGAKDNSKKLSDSPVIDRLTPENKISNNWTLDKIEGSKLVFKNGQIFETNLFELEFIGQIPVNNKAPYCIFSGRDCEGCDESISIYIHSPSDGQLNVEHGQNRYEYPGTEKDYETDSVLCISRAFYGRVLENKDGVIWYENRLLENGKMARFVFLAHVDNGTLKDTTYDDNGSLNQTLDLLSKELCKEIKGRQYTSEP